MEPVEFSFHSRNREFSLICKTASTKGVPKLRHFSSRSQMLFLSQCQGTLTFGKISYELKSRSILILPQNGVYTLEFLESDDPSDFLFESTSIQFQENYTPSEFVDLACGIYTPSCTDFDTALSYLLWEPSSEKMEKERLLKERIVYLLAWMKNIEIENRFPPFDSYENSGLSSKEYTNLKKVSIAKHLLIETDIPMADIAERLDFCDLPHFSRFFKKQTGENPGEFRNKEILDFVIL